MIPRDVQPTAEQLRAAYARLYRAPTWPTTLDQALAHPVYGSAVRAVARRLACSTPPPAAAPAPPPAAATPSPARHPHLPRDLFDAKSAAANDRDETEF